jgi:hypothetical protein
LAHYKGGVLIRSDQLVPASNKFSGIVTTGIFHGNFIFPGHTTDLEVAYLSPQEGRERDSQCGL